MINLFIVGVGRSGTSLLQSILSSHSKIAIPPETGFVRHNILSWERYTDLHMSEFLDKNEKLERVKEFLSDEKEEEFETGLDFYITLVKNYLGSKEKSIAGDKDPRLVEFVQAVSKLFPSAKFIHLVRDPRDVLLSKKKAQWSKGKPSWYHIFANYAQLKIGELQGHKLPKDKYLSITYEGLLEEPETTIKRICSFMDVEFEKSMLSFQEKAKELVSEDEKQWKKETMGPLLKNNTGKWKGKLADWEVALTENLCRQAFKIGEYEKGGSYEKLSIYKKLKVSSLTFFLRALGKIYMPYRIWSQKLLVAWKY